MKTRTAKSVTHQRGSTNVYADLGYKSADEMGFSERKLMDCLTLLGRDVEIVVRTASKRKGQGAVSVSFA